MPAYINPPGPPTDPDDLAQAAFDTIRETFPNYDPREGQLATLVITALALRAAQINDLAQLIPQAIFRWYGTSVLRFPPDDGSPAQASLQLTVRDSNGYTIASETEFVLTDPNTGDAHVFYLLTDAVVPLGDTSVVATAIAREDGTAANDILDASVQPVDHLDSLIDVSQVGITAGGVDEEEDDAYLDRLATRASLPVRPVWASDFSSLVLINFRSVQRALFIDNFIPPSTYNAERAVAGLLLDANGNDLQPVLGDQVIAFLETQREWGFIVNILPAQYTVVDVTYDFLPNTGYDPTDVLARANEALTNYLSSAAWGSGGDGGQTFEYRPTVYLWEIVTVLNNVIGLERLTSLTVGKNSGAQSGADLDLDGPIPLTAPGVFVGTYPNSAIDQ